MSDPYQISVLADCRPALPVIKSGIGHFAQAVQRAGPHTRNRLNVLHPQQSKAPEDGPAELLTAIQIERSACDLFFSPLFVVPPIRVARLVICIHDPFPATHRSLCTEDFLRLWQSRLPPALRAACFVVTVSSWSRDHLIHSLNLPSDRVRVIGQSIAPHFTPNPPGQADILARYDLSTQQYVLTLGDGSERKNLTRLRAAMASPALSDIVLAIAGPPSEGLSHEDRIACKQLGYVSDEDLPAVIAGARCLAFPSLAEGFGRPCIEAMACGTPVVASSSTAFPEVCGEAALLPNPEDTGAIAEAITRACHDEPLRRRLIAAGYTRAAAFTSQHFADDLDNAFEAAMATDGSPVWGPERDWDSVRGMVTR